MSESKRVYLVRHGQIFSNVEGRYAGRSGEPLVQEGRDQMVALGNALQHAVAFGEIWTSQIERARESASLLSGVLGVPAKHQPGLDEMLLGPWEGLTETEASQADPMAWETWMRRPDQLMLPGRETLDQLSSRVMPVIAQAAQRPHPVLLVTHVAPIRVAALRVLGVPLSQYKRLRIANAECVVADLGRADVWRFGNDESLRSEIAAGGMAAA